MHWLGCLLLQWPLALGDLEDGLCHFWKDLGLETAGVGVEATLGQQEVLAEPGLVHEHGDVLVLVAGGVGIHLLVTVELRHGLDNLAALGVGESSIVASPPILRKEVLVVVVGLCLVEAEVMCRGHLLIVHVLCSVCKVI